jgi:hypothetical protein
MIPFFKKPYLNSTFFNKKNLGLGGSILETVFFTLTVVYYSL